jgi:small-conductance mechanosensitive channel
VLPTDIEPALRQALLTISVAIVGLGGLTASIAAQSTIADVIDGLLILFDRPFRVGDRIQIQELQTWGDVWTIGLRTTRIRTLDNRMVIVPNSKIGRSQVVNYSYPDRKYRLEVYVSVAYGADVEAVRALFVEAVTEVDGVLGDKPVDALVDALDDGAIKFRVRCWIDSYADFRHARDRIQSRLYAAFQVAGLQSPTPTYDVRLTSSSGSPTANPPIARCAPVGGASRSETCGRL